MIDAGRPAPRTVTGRSLYHPRRRELLKSLGVLAASALAPRAQALDVQEALRMRYDVPFVPTPQVTVDEMLRLAGVGPADFVIDLGSGDGRIVVTAAAKFGARGMGVDLDPELIEKSEARAIEARVAERVRFARQDLFEADLSQATVITMYLLPSVVRRLKPRLLSLKPGTRIVSHDFDMEDWKPDRTTTVRKTVMLWIVPARVEGLWRMRLPLPPIERHLELEFKQRYQELDAVARLNGVRTNVWEARIEGDHLTFAIVDSTVRENEATLYFDARVKGDVMEGIVARGVGSTREVVKWRAVRVTS